MNRVLALGAIACLILAAKGVSGQQYQVKYYPLNTLDSQFVQVDLNSDGIPDFIESHQGGTQELLSSGAGNYNTENITIPSAPVLPLGSGDFNNDQNADVVFAHPFGVAYGDGAGGFTSFNAITMPSSAGNALDAKVADFTGDGQPDIAVLTLAGDWFSGATFELYVFANNGSGFNPGTLVYSQPVPQGAQPIPYSTWEDLLLGDFDADGHADLVLRTTTSTAENPAQAAVTITALYGDGNGGFAPVNISTSENTAELTAADINNDGVTDFVANTFTYGSGSPTIYYGQHNRTFTQTSVNAANDEQINAMLADFDGNGLKDIVYPAEAQSSTENIGVTPLLQAPLGTFDQSGFYPVDTYDGSQGLVPFSQTFVGDYNHDGRPDVALISAGGEVNHPNSLVIILNQAGRPDGACMTPSGTGLSVCSPQPGATVNSSVRFSFSANLFYPVRKMEVWIDGVKKSETYEVFGTEGFADPVLELPSGNHTVDLYAVAFDQTTLLHKTYQITVR
jgi:hypothetical protein